MNKIFQKKMKENVLIYLLLLLKEMQMNLLVCALLNLLASSLS